MNLTIVRNLSYIVILTILSNLAYAEKVQVPSVQVPSVQVPSVQDTKIPLSLVKIIVSEAVEEALKKVIATEAKTKANNKPKKLSPELQKMEQEKARLELESALKAAKHLSALSELTAEKDRLILENELRATKEEYANAALNTEKDKLTLEQELLTAKQTKELAKFNADKERLETEYGLHEQKQKNALKDIEAKIAKIDLENSLQDSINKREQASVQKEIEQMGFDMQKMEYEQIKLNHSTYKLESQIIKLSVEQQWNDIVNKQPEYLLEPFNNGELVISDRRINLDTIILPGTADYVTNRIFYYNNKNSTYPIFLIMDTCNGGSVMEGARILQAMASSDAPIYVVVKTLAGSMAADIAALADRAYAYPNALIVHHQMSKFYFFRSMNPTEQKEELEMLEAWSQRLLLPVAKKMGLKSIDEFVKKMYEKSISGNWREYAEGAKKLKWIDDIVTKIRETSFLTKPTDKALDSTFFRNYLIGNSIKTADTPKDSVNLPHLVFDDFYYLYNPDNYYRY
jgi:ATP-dependent Clp protease protease subunit